MSQKSTDGVFGGRKQRSAAMRTRLLDATVQCLVSTVTPEPPRRESPSWPVSPGAHRSTTSGQQDLVVAAIEDLDNNARKPRPRTQRVQTVPTRSRRPGLLVGGARGPDVHCAVAVGGGPHHSVLAQHISAYNRLSQYLISAIAQLVPDHPAQRRFVTSSTRRWTRCGGSWWRILSTATPPVRADAGTGPASTCGCSSPTFCLPRRWAKSASTRIRPTQMLSEAPVSRSSNPSSGSRPPIGTG